MVRLVGIDGLGAAHDGAQLVHRLDIAQRHGLREQIADGRALDGAGDNRTVEGVGCELVQQLILAAAADDVQRIDALALDLLETLECPAVFECERFVDAPRDLADGLGHRLVRPAAVILNFLDHPATGEELAVIGFNDGAEGLCLLCFLDNVVPAEALTGLLPVAAALLNEPQAHDVFERPEAALDRALVGEIRVAHGVRQDRLIRLHAEQRPRARRAEREAARAGDGCHGRGRVVRADGGEAGLIDAQLLGQLRAEFAAQRARAVELRENFTRQAQRADRLPVPVLCSGVIEHGGRCVGVFRLCLARQEEAQQIRHQQHRLGRVQRGIFLQLAAVELVDGVEIHRRDARAGKERREIDSLPDGLHILVERVAVRARIGQQLAVFVQQTVIDTPGVDADAVQIADVRVFERQQTLLQLVVEIWQIPIEHAVHLDVVVFKPVQLAHGDRLAVELAQDRAAVARAEVECQQVSHGVMPLSSWLSRWRSRSFRARSASRSRRSGWQTAGFPWPG